MIKDYSLAIRQLKDKAFWKPVVWSSLLSLMIFPFILIIGATSGGILYDWLLSYFDFIEKESWMRTVTQVVIGVALVVFGFFLFGSIHAAFLGLFIDGAIDAIKNQHYPKVKLRPAPALFHSTLIAGRFIGFSLVVNLLVSPLYLIGWFFPPIGIAMQIIVNGFLLGKEYKEIIQYRLPREMYNPTKSVTLHGCIGTMIWMIPILNFFAPLLVCASIFHAQIKK